MTPIDLQALLARLEKAQSRCAAGNTQTWVEIDAPDWRAVIALLRELCVQ